MKVWFTNDGAQLQVVVQPGKSDTPVYTQCLGDKGTAAEAHMLALAFQQDQERRMQAIREEAYLTGWSDAKKKKRKRTTFWCSDRAGFGVGY